MSGKIDALLDEVNTMFAKSVGGPIIQRATDVTNPFVLRRPTFISSLDIALGGGFPAGTLCQISAPAGIGKNALCNQTVAACQSIYGEDSCIAWVSTEMSLDKQFAQMFGVRVPMSDFEIEMAQEGRTTQGLPPLTDEEVQRCKESIGDFVLIDSGSSAQRLEVTLKLIESNKFQLIIIDSMASLLTDVQDETDLEDNPQQSSEAALITRFCQKYWGRAGRSFSAEERANWTTVITTYQVRANRSTAKYKKAWSVGGAYALRHAKAIDIVLEQGDRYPADRSKPQVGKDVKWTIAKGKAGCHEGLQGVVRYYFDDGYDVCKDLTVAAQSCGILVRAGRYWRHVESSTKNVINEFSGGMSAVVQELRADSNLFSRMYKDVMREMGVACVYR